MSHALIPQAVSAESGNGLKCISEFNVKILKLLSANQIGGVDAGEIASLAIAEIKKGVGKQAIYMSYVKKFGQKAGQKYWSLTKNEIENFIKNKNQQ